jgi:hypothetical protein
MSGRESGVVAVMRTPAITLMWCPCGTPTPHRCACGTPWCSECFARHTSGPDGRCATAVFHEYLRTQSTNPGGPPLVGFTPDQRSLNEGEE